MKNNSDKINKPSKLAKTTPNNVRIIGGIYKKTKLDVLNIEGLRPTPDRLRETLFNWLGDISEISCLDMFAGTGALGFECLSRQAKHVVMIEKNKSIYNNLQSIQQKLKITNDALNIINSDSFLYANNNLYSSSGNFDVIFIDPPYTTNLLDKILPIAIKLLNKHGFIYVEDNKDLSNLIKDNNLFIYRHVKMGQIYAYLLVLGNNTNV